MKNTEESMTSIYVAAVLGFLVLAIAGHAHHTTMSNIKAARAAERAALEQQHETEQQASLKEAVRLIQRAK